MIIKCEWHVTSLQWRSGLAELAEGIISLNSLTQIMDCDQWTIIILQVAMDSPAYIYFFPPMAQQLPSFSHLPACQPLSFTHNPAFHSTGPGFGPDESFHALFYPISFSAASLASNFHIALDHNLQQPPSYSCENQLGQQGDKEAADSTPPAQSPSEKALILPKMEEPLLSCEMGSSCRKQPVVRPPARRKVDRDYNPLKMEKKVSRKRTHENQNRNVIPNEVNQIISFIQKRNKSGHLLSRLFERFPERQSYSIARFYLYQSLLKEKTGHYSSERSLKLIGELYQPECRIWAVDQQRYYNKLCRLLVRHFLLEESIFIILTSKRMKRQKKIDHLRARRVVAERVLGMLSAA